MVNFRYNQGLYTWSNYDILFSIKVKLLKCLFKMCQQGIQ